ncbi:murein hydrolase activator EnvC family protein [Niallia sp. 03133]|uniref:murein hydrolase activator EnvC family protein n=1 Tax=Niallia sp. 03133 TaxID=3458060 RepID=UPI004043B67A
MKKQLDKPSSVISIGIAAFFLLFMNDSIAFAASDDINGAEIESEINSAKQELYQLKSEEDKINLEVKRLDMLISDINQKIREKNEEILHTKLKIEEINTEITDLQDRLKKREELLKERVRSYQQTGSIGILDVLMGAQTFRDFIDRVGAVSTIVNADGNLIREHIEDKELLESKQISVKAKLENLQKNVEDMNAMKKELDVQKKEKDAVMASLKADEETMEKEKLNLEEEQSVLAAQEAAIGKAIGQGADQNNINNILGKWTKPAQGQLTSKLGERWNKFHAGIDIANPSDVPIVAAANGVVSRSYYSTSYGNVIFITHSIKGQIFTTVYAHMDSRTVQEGASVSGGQQIGIMGNTGQSFGQHLHFEMHKGEWNAAKSNAVNPLDYISM